jgi:hypothetical protein
MEGATWVLYHPCALYSMQCRKRVLCGQSHTVQRRTAPEPIPERVSHSFASRLDRHAADRHFPLPTLVRSAIPRRPFMVSCVLMACHVPLTSFGLVALSLARDPSSDAILVLLKQYCLSQQMHGISLTGMVPIIPYARCTHSGCADVTSPIPGTHGGDTAYTSSPGSLDTIMHGLPSSHQRSKIILHMNRATFSKLRTPICPSNSLHPI